MLAPETAAHAAGTSALLPMLALGIPGSATAAVLLGGLMIWGLQPGPLLFVEKKEFVWGLIASMYLGNVAGLIIVLATVPIFAAIMRIPFALVAPIILIVCAIGAYTIESSRFDIWLMLVFGVVGYVFKKLDYPLAPLVLALVLGDRAEDAFRQALLGSGGDLRCVLLERSRLDADDAGVTLLFWGPITDLVARVRGRRATPAGAEWDQAKTIEPGQVNPRGDNRSISRRPRG